MHPLYSAGSVSALSGLLFILSGSVPHAALIDYFRAQGGVAAHTGRLPEDLNNPRVLQWKTPVPEGQSSPVVGGDRVYVTGYDAASRSLRTLCLAITDGRPHWQRAIPTEHIETFHPREGSAAPSTPATDGERVYVFFGSYGLVCYDREGERVWERRMGPFRDEYGAGSSPILVGGTVILCQDHDVDSFVAAYDRDTGRELWRTPRPNAVRSYATPVLWNANGRRQLLVAGALELTAYDPDDGSPLWWTGGLARIVIPLPVFDQERIYMASWAPGGDRTERIALDSWTTAAGKWDGDGDGELSREEIKDPNVLDRFYRMDLDQSGRLNEAEWIRHAEVFSRAQNALLAIRPSVTKGPLPEEDIVWTYPRGTPYVASPLVDDGLFWMVKDGGIVTRIDTATGRPISVERLPEASGKYYASPVAADGKIYFCSEPGVVSVVANEHEWRVLSSKDFEEKIHATPAIHENRILIRTSQALYSFGAK